MGADQGHGWRGLIKDAASGGFDVFFRLTRVDNGICWKIQVFFHGLQNSFLCARVNLN